MISKIDAMDYDFYETYIENSDYLDGHKEDDDFTYDSDIYSYGGSRSRKGHNYSSKRPSSGSGSNALARLIGYILFLIIVAVIGCFVNELLAVIILFVVAYISIFF